MPPFVTLFLPYGRFHFLLSLLSHRNGLSSAAHAPVRAHSLRTPPAASYLRVDYCAIALWGLCHSPRLAPPSPDVGIIMRWNPGFAHPGSRQPGPNICRGSRSAAAAFWLHRCRRREKTRGCGARPSLLRQVDWEMVKEDPPTRVGGCEVQHTSTKQDHDVRSNDWRKQPSGRPDAAPGVCELQIATVVHWCSEDAEPICRRFSVLMSWCN